MKEFFKRIFKKIQYLWWRLIYMTCIAEVKGKLSKVEGLFVDDRLISEFCSKGVTPKDIVYIIVNNYLKGVAWGQCGVQWGEKELSDAAKRIDDGEKLDLVVQDVTKNMIEPVKNKTENVKKPSQFTNR